MSRLSATRSFTLRAFRKLLTLTLGVVRRVQSTLEISVDQTSSRISDSSSLGSPVSDYLLERSPRTNPIVAAAAPDGQRPSVTVFAFLDQGGFFGGIATLLMVAATLANRLEYDLRVVQTISNSPNTDVLGFLSTQGITVKPSRFHVVDMSNRKKGRDSLPLTPQDVIVVSAWWDAYVAERIAHPRRFVYLVQDFEPIFYNNGDTRIAVESTYESNKFHAIVNSSPLADYFRSHDYPFMENAAVFEPAVMTNIPTNRAPREKRILFLYARPEVDRNLFLTALAAVDFAFCSGELDSDKWEVYVAGSSKVPRLVLSNGVPIIRLGKLPLEEYKQFIDSVDVAVSPMLAPHPNYPTLEFAAAGAHVVTTSWETKTDLSRYSENIRVARARTADLANAIVRACVDAENPEYKRSSPAELTRSWSTALEKSVDKLVEQLEADELE